RPHAAEDRRQMGCGRRRHRAARRVRSLHDSATRAAGVLPARTRVGRRPRRVELPRRSGEGREDVPHSEEEVMLRHTLATLAYRAAKVLRGAPADFSGFTPVSGGRSAGQILAHLGDLMDWAASIAEGKQTWHDSPVQAWDADVQRFFAAVAKV